jgi:hypothetical protein
MPLLKNIDFVSELYTIRPSLVDAVGNVEVVYVV